MGKRMKITGHGVGNGSVEICGVDISEHVISASVQIGKDKLARVYLELFPYDFTVELDDCIVDGLSDVQSEHWLDKAHRKLDVVQQELNKTLDEFIEGERSRVTLPQLWEFLTSPSSGVVTAYELLRLHREADVNR